ncbi:hypothetical protein CMQ_282 [Grosmannia clavigera kw1407]|uniref:Uncharacterized protein n=1 Tax=Grosmannia clavigera (strain kw1407 / UAMH 11150) TaxID=655863 RepID=F0XRI3_GROCL|nr:uncharacterized protein CMQ_282 [Grosmannia clavigera kw1407]EFW99964.1 hypothetical protein CMQ_282 [Grosmannia clavigera kw1407]
MTNFTAERKPHFNEKNISSAQMAHAFNYAGGQFTGTRAAQTGELVAATGTLAGTDGSQIEDIGLEIEQSLVAVSVEESDVNDQPRYTLIDGHLIRSETVTGIVNKCVQNAIAGMTKPKNIAELGAPPTYTTHGIVLQNPNIASNPTNGIFPSQLQGHANTSAN